MPCTSANQLGNSNPGKLDKTLAASEAAVTVETSLSPSNSRTRVSATVGWRLRIMLRQSAQLAQNAGRLVRVALLSQPTKRKRQCGSVSCDGTDVNGRNTQNHATTLPNALVMLSCKCSDKIRPHHTQDVIRPGRGTM